MSRSNLFLSHSALQVKEVYLENNSLSGTLPASWSNLTKVHVFRFARQSVPLSIVSDVYSSSSKHAPLSLTCKRVSVSSLSALSPRCEVAHDNFDVLL